MRAEAVCGSPWSMGLHFPQEQLTRLNPIFARLLSPLLRSRGCHRHAPLQASNLAKTIARDKPVSTFECTRKHYEHGYNINDNHALKYSMITSSVINTILMQAGYLYATVICNDRIEIKCTDRMSEATSRKDSKSEHVSVGRLRDTT